MELVTDFFAFLKTRKKYWLLPIFIVMGILGLMLVMSNSSAVAPFIYTLF